MKYIIDIPETFKYTVEMGITQNGSIRSKAILNAVKDAIPYKEQPHGKWLVSYECPNCGEIRNTPFKVCPQCKMDMKEAHPCEECENTDCDRCRDIKEWTRKSGEAE